MKVREGLLKYVSPKVPVDRRLDTVRALASALQTDSKPVEGAESLGPADRLTTLFILSFDSDPDVSKEAAEAFNAFGPGELASALEQKLDARLLKKLVKVHGADPSVLMLIAKNPGADSNIKEMIALKKPAEKVSVKIEPEVEDEELGIYQKILGMNTADKLKLAFTGGKTERGLLINDGNKVVSNAVLKNPRITVGEIVRVVNSKTASDDVLRLIARNREWVKNRGVQVGLITNPRTPLPIAMRFLDRLDKRELTKIAKSKNVSSVLSAGALRKMQRMR